MARRRTDLWDEFFEALRWVFSVVHPLWSVPVAVVFFLVPVIWFEHSIKIPQAQLLGLAIGGIPALICLAAGLGGWKARQKRTTFLQQHVDIAWLNKLSWQDFEKQVAEIYRQQGYSVDEVGGGGADGGVDLRLERDGQKILVQCKRWRTFKVGVRPVRELFGVLMAERANRAIFITSGVYTDEAVRFAKGKPLDIIDGAQLAEMLRGFQLTLRKTLAAHPVADSSSGQSSTGSDSMPARPRCPRCGSDMILRRAKSGRYVGREFWGCLMYSKRKCSGIREVTQ